ncbi:hypothetical protein OROHE_010114 [Orobanche hederae]
MRLLMNNGIPFDIRFIIEAKVRIAEMMSKKMAVCYKCARWNYDSRCRFLEIPSINREDKIQFIKDGLNKENLDDIEISLDTYPSRLVHYGIRHLWNKFKLKYEQRLGNLTLKDPVCQFNHPLPQKRFNFICIFDGASHGNEAFFTEEAHNLGRTLGEKYIHIVYKGGSLGLMGRGAASAYMKGVKVLGIIPQPLAESKITGATIGDEFRAVNMQDRITHVTNNADAFITLLGGFSILEKLFHVVTRAQLNIHKKPIGLLNINGFFDGLLSFINYPSEKSFISERTKQIIVVATTPEELIKKLIAFVPELDPALANIVWMEDFTVRKCKIDAFHSL